MGDTKSKLGKHLEEQASYPINVQHLNERSFLSIIRAYISCFIDKKRKGPFILGLAYLILLIAYTECKYGGPLGRRPGRVA